MSNLTKIIFASYIGIFSTTVSTNSINSTIECRLDPQTTAKHVIIGHDRYTTIKRLECDSETIIELYDHDSDGIGNQDSIKIKTRNYTNSDIIYEAKIIDNKIHESWNIHTKYDEGFSKIWDLNRDITKNKITTDITIQFAKMRGINEAYNKLLQGKTTPKMYDILQKWELRSHKIIQKTRTIPPDKTIIDES